MTDSGNTPGCPQVIIRVSDIDDSCSAEGGRVVTLQAIVIGTGGTISAQLDVVGSGLPPAFGSEFGSDPLVLNWVGELPAGSDATIEVRITEPADVPPTTATFHVPECRPAQVSFNQIQINDCDESGNRQVSIQAVVTGDQPISAVLLIDNTVVSTEGGASTLVLSGSAPVAAGSVIPVTMTIVNPPNAPSTSFILHVPACDEVEVEVEVPSLCPQVIINPAIGTCDDDGERSVDISATITGQPGQAISAQLLMNAVEVDAVSNAVQTAALTGSIRVIAGGVVNVDVNITEPANSPVVSTSIQVPACDQVDVVVEVPTPCPQVSINPVIGECDAGNQRAVSVTAAIAGQPGQDLAARLLMDGAEVDAATNAVENATLSGALVVPAGGAVDVEVEVIEPAGCPSSNLLIQVPECDEVEVEVEVPTPCPQVVINQVIGACSANDERTVSISADISGQPGQAIQGKLVINGVKVDSVSPAIQNATLTGSVDAPAGSTVAVEVHVAEPAGCPVFAATVQIPRCGDGDGDERPKKGGKYRGKSRLKGASK